MLKLILKEEVVFCISSEDFVVRFSVLQLFDQKKKNGGGDKIKRHPFQYFFFLLKVYENILFPFLADMNLNLHTLRELLGDLQLAPSLLLGGAHR